MKWSFPLGTFAGIRVFVHATFLLLIGWIGVSHWLASRSVATTVEGVGFILLLFLCVLLHEYGHALTARRYGVKTRDIVLLPIGGLARLESIPEEPRKELAIAAAGPAVNVAIAAGLWFWLQLTGGFLPVDEVALTTGPLAERLLVANIVLVVFNLVPAFPMDGGRMLRAFLAMNLPYARATEIAANVGQGLAFLLGFLGLFTNPFLLFIAFFVFIGASHESSLVQARSGLDGVPLARVMMTEFQVLSPHDPLERAVDLTLSGSQKDFPVLEGDAVVGILVQGDLLRALTERGRGVHVEEVMERTFESADLHEASPGVFARLQACSCRTMPVTLGGRLVGLLTLENVGEFLSIRSAVQKRA